MPMEPLERDRSLRDYWRVIVRRRSLVLVSIVTAVIIALGFSLAQTPIYSSSAEVLVQPRTEGSLFEFQAGNQSTDTRTIDTEIQVFERDTVRQRVQEMLGLEELPPEVDATGLGDTDVISAAVRSEEPRTAQVLADAYALAYIEVRREQSVNELLAASAEVQQKVTELQAQIDQLPEDDARRSALVDQQATFEQTLDQLQVDAALRTGGASVIKFAELPTDPVEPTPARSALLAGIVGLLIGLAAAFLVDYLDSSVRSGDDLKRLADVPVLATVPVDPPPDNRPVALSRPDDHAVETYRALRTNLQILGIDRPAKVIQVTSSIAGEGKTTTASNLAVVFAQVGERIVLVDADLRRPRLHEAFALLGSPGLTGVVRGESLDAALRTVELDGGVSLDVLPSGEPPPNPGELLSHHGTIELLAALRARYDRVIVDSAPVLPVADSMPLASTVDAVLLVAQADRVTTANVSESLERLGRIGAAVVGIVLNQAVGVERGPYRYGGYTRVPTPEGERGDGDEVGQPPVADVTPAGGLPPPISSNGHHWPAPVASDVRSGR